MNTQIMMVKNQEMTVAAFAMVRSNNPVYGALQTSKANELLKALRNGIVHGFFTKKDGTVREFWGTTNKSLASKNTVHEIGTAPRLPLGIIPFMDVEDNCRWKSMRIGSLISFE